MKLITRAAISLLVMASAAQAELLDYTVDQRHDATNVSISAHNIQMTGPLVQEFIPQASGLKVVELWTEDFGTPRSNGLGVTLQVALRADTTNGIVLGISQRVRLPDDYNGVTRFDFAETIALQPGQRYALEVQLVSGDAWGVHSYGREDAQYLPGRYFRGSKTDGLDMWFRTGLTPAALHIRLVSPQRIEWQGDPSLTYRVWGSTDLGVWQELGSVTSVDSTFEFETKVDTAPHRFFKVSAP